MKILTTKDALQQELASLRAEGRTIGFVPTMGALHKGHGSLVKQCVEENDVCVVSVFVNPTQFNNAEDLEKYPRNIAADAAFLETLGTKIVFNPSAEEVYSAKELQETFTFDFGGLDKVMEGKFRPGHFNGVVQVVSKLFDLVQPQKAYFGEKDFQQLAIIHRMVNMLNYPVEIINCPIVREESGLAMSSRNERLSEKEKQTATNISRILFESKKQIESKTIAEVQSWVTEQINNIEGLEVEYYEIVDNTTLQAAQKWENATGCITVYCGPVRLIDNINYL